MGSNQLNTPPTCEQAIDWLLEEPAAGSPQHDMLDRHLAGCPACQAERSRIEEMQVMFTDFVPREPSPDFSGKVIEAIQGENRRVNLRPAAFLLAGLLAVELMAYAAWKTAMATWWNQAIAQTSEWCDLWIIGTFGDIAESFADLAGTGITWVPATDALTSFSIALAILVFTVLAVWKLWQTGDHHA